MGFKEHGYVVTGYVMNLQLPGCKMLPSQCRVVAPAEGFTPPGGPNQRDLPRVRAEGRAAQGSHMSIVCLVKANGRGCVRPAMFSAAAAPAESPGVSRGVESRPLRSHPASTIPSASVA